MFNDILVNIIANVITTLIFTLVGLSVYLIFFVMERQRLLHFFGISHNLPAIRVYLSRMEIKPGGTVGVEPLIAGYSGPAINKVEYEGALLVRNLFRSQFLGLLPKRFRDWLGKQSITMIDLEPPIDISPLKSDIVSFDNLILIGGPVYNLVSKYYLDSSYSHFYFSKDGKGERVLKIREGELKDVEIPGRNEGRELAIIQRIRDREYGNTVFMCAGLGSSASYGGVRYLIENWQSLQQKYGNESFAICLVFPNQPSDSEAVVRPKVIW